MQDLNEIRITGTLYNGPNCKPTQKGGRRCMFSVGVKREEPSKVIDFLNVLAWDDGAAFIEENFHEHSRIYIKGEMHLDKYVSADGVEKKQYRIIPSEIQDPDDPDISYVIPKKAQKVAEA